MNITSSGTASRLASQSGLVIAGNAFTLLVGLPFQIYLARVLGAEQLGAFGVFEVIAQTAGALSALGLSYTVVRFIPVYLRLGENGHVRQLLTIIYVTTVMLGLIAATLVMVGSERFIEWIPELRQYSSLLPFAGAMTFLGMLSGLSTQSLRAFLDIRWMILIGSVLQLIVKILLTITLLWLGWQLKGYLVAVVASLGFSLSGMLWGLRSHWLRLEHTTEAVSRETRKIWWSYSRTMYSSYLIGIALPPVERFLIGATIDLASLGIWTAVRQLQNLPQIFLQVIITVAAPMFVGAGAKGETEEVTHLYRIATDWVGRLGFPLVIFLAIFGAEILNLYGTPFSAVGHWPLLVLMIGQFVNLATGPVGTLLNQLGQEKAMFRINLFSNVVFLVSLLTLAPILGLLGVAAAAALSTILSNLTAVRVMKRQLGINWWSLYNQKQSLPLVVCGVSTILLRYADLVHTAWQLALALVVTYGVFFIGYLSRGLSSEDKAIYHMVRKGFGIANERRD